MKKQFFLLVLLISTLASTCEKENDEMNDNDIFGYWRYQSGISAKGDDETPRAYIQLNEDGTLTGFTSRNIIQGKFTYDSSGSIKLEVVTTTKVADTEFSSAFSNFLELADRYKLDDDKLILTDSESKESVTFSRKTPDECKAAVVDEKRFQNPSSDKFDLFSVVVQGTCLAVSIGYGGGCKEVKLEAIGSGAYGKSLPVVTNLKFIFEDKDDCEAYINKTFYFDLLPLKFQNDKELILNVEGWNELIKVRF